MLGSGRVGAHPERVAVAARGSHVPLARAGGRARSSDVPLRGVGAGGLRIDGGLEDLHQILDRRGDLGAELG